MKSCPTCHLMLQAVEWDGPAAWVCSSCGGLWTADADARAVVQRSSELAGLFPGTVSMSMYEGLPMSCPQCRIVQLAAVAGTGPARWCCPKCGGAWMAVGVAGEQTRPAEAERARAERSAEVPADELARATDEPAARASSVVGAEPLPAVAPVEPATTPPVAPTPPPAPAASASSPGSAPQAPAPAPQPERHVTEAPRKPPATPVEALECLKAGNRRYVNDASLNPHRGAARRAETARTQSPFAAVVGCSDSRVPPELVFDQGIGDLFVVRDVGHVVGPSAQAGLAYAIDVLGIRLVLVLGHRGCGAIAAAVQGGGHYPYMQAVIDEISPAVVSARAMPGDPTETAVRENVRRVVTQLLSGNWMIADRARNGRIAVEGAIYDVATGRVEFIDNLDPFKEPAQEVDASLYSRTLIGGEAQAQAAPTDGQSHAAPAPAPGQTARPANATVGDVQVAPEAHPPRAAALWCPECRGGFHTDLRYCVRCGVPLVPATFRVPCLACRRENTIEAARCWACSADLHPEPSRTKTRSAPSGMQPRPQLPPGGGRPAKAGESCATQIVAIAFVVTLAAMLPQITAGLSQLFGGAR